MTGGYFRTCCGVAAIFFLLSSVIPAIQAQDPEPDLKYAVNEEAEPDIFIGDIENDLNLKNQMDAEAYQNLAYSILSSGNSFAAYFYVDNKTGVLYTLKPLDRDSLSNCAFEISCSVPIKVAATGGGYFRQIYVEITIKDINDNSPVFEKDSFATEIAEGAGRDTKVSIEGAVDSDSGNFSVQNYYISTPGTPFGVTFDKYFDGRTVVKLGVTGELDREKKDFYEITLIAEDGGDPKKMGELPINVTILDVNDNAPQFDRTFYNVTVPEDIEINKSILTVNATDPDAGRNGEVFYKLGSVQQDGIMDLFAIDSETGVLSVTGQLVYDSTEKLRVIVEASDKGSSPQIKQVQVFVNILDSSNNPPFITLNVLKGGVVSEHENVGSVVAHISVFDDDTGRNGKITCESDSDDFRLERIRAKDYKAVVWRPLNRELKEEHLISVICSDNGVPPLNSTASFTVRLSDENDNPPRFTQGTYFAKLPENNDIGKVVTYVTASDIDVGRNARITYSLADTQGYDFWIDGASGEIRANFKIDRENVSHINIRVKAIDDGLTKLTGTAQVIVTVTDVNDNVPVFELPLYEFPINEEVPFNTTVSKLVATDADQGVNGDVSFSFDLQPSSSFPFILFSDGTLKLIRALDREAVSRYEFTVIARDQGEPSLSSSATVVVSVLDINDNAPVFVFPNNVNNTAQVSLSSAPDTVIAIVRANDTDEGDNGAISYSILDNNVSSVFKLESEKGFGTIRLLRLPGSSEALVYSLTLKASDNGTPRLFSITSLTVTFIREPAEDNSKQNFLIAVSLACVTVVLSVAIVLTICLIRRHDRMRNGDKMVNKIVAPSSTDSKQSLTDSRDSLKKVSFSMDFNSPPNPDKGGPPPNAPAVNQDVFKVSENGRMPSSSSSPRSSDRVPPSDPDMQKLDPTTVLQLHRSLLQSHDHMWTNHRDDHTPPLTKEILKRHEDTGSESSGETATCDSGRGGSESDIQTSYISQSHDTDHIKTVTFANKPLLHHITTEQDWKNPRDFSTKGQYGPSDSKHNVHNNHMNSNRLPVPKRDYSSAPSSSSHMSKPRHGYNLSPIQDTSVGFGASYDDDDDTTTSGSYTIDQEDWNPDQHNQSSSYILSHNEAYC